MKHINWFLIILIVGLLIGCGGSEAPPEPGPDDGAREWIDAMVNQDGNRILKHTCKAQRDNVKQAGMWISAFSVLEQLFTNQSVQIKGDISDLKFETVNQEDDQAEVRVYGELRVAVLANAEAYDVDERWQMIRENDTWRWCSSSTGVSPLVPTNTPIQQVAQVTSPSTATPTITPTPNVEATATAEIQRPLLLVQLTGKILTASSEVPGVGTHIYVMEADGSNMQQLTDGETLNFGGVWSPDGKTIVFVSLYRPDNKSFDIYLMDAGGSNVRRLTDLEGYEQNPQWSPDGKRIVFNSYDFADGRAMGDIYVMNADGSNLKQLTFEEGYEWRPVWSPNGKQIMFLSDRDGPIEIYVMEADGSNWVKIIGPELHPGNAMWSPDGKKIAFVSNKDGNGEIYVMNVDGSNLQRLTNDPGVLVSQYGRRMGNGLPLSQVETGMWMFL